MQHISYFLIAAAKFLAKATIEGRLVLSHRRLAGKEGWWYSASFLHLLQPRTPVCGMMLPTIRVGCPSQLILSGSIAHRHTLRCVSMEIQIPSS